MSSGRFSLSGQLKLLSMMGMILHWESRAATISCSSKIQRGFEWRMEMNDHCTDYRYILNKY
jgi:hypothetical protein